MQIVKNHKRLTALTVVAMLAATGVALAYWTGSGAGSGDADVGTSGQVTVTATVAPGIAPGTSAAVGLAAANGTGSPIQVTTVHLVSVAADVGHAACDTDDFTMEDVTESHEVPANATAEALPQDGSLVYANTGVNQDACKDATLTLTLSTS